MTEFEPLTYAKVGASADPTLPTGYRHLDVHRTIGSGRADFEAAVDALMHWELHRRAGVRISTSTPPASTGVEARLSLGAGPLRIRARCRVVYTIDEAGEKGFAYGTLPGHPESGEERFAIVHESDDSVSMHIRAFSRAAVWWTRLTAPVGRLAQRSITRRYLRAFG